MATPSIFDAIRAGDLPALENLLTAEPGQAEARDKGISALLTALYHGQPVAAEKIRQTLRSTGTGLDVFEAAAVGDCDRLRALLGADPARARAFSADGFTALHLACFFNQPDACRLLLDAGAPVAVAAENLSRVHPLHSAAAVPSAEIVTLLLEHGAAVDSTQHGGWTALMAAAKHGDRASVAALLAAGADPGARSDDGSTAGELADPAVADLLA
jgi:ankyrin repeat protein